MQLLASKAPSSLAPTPTLRRLPHYLRLLQEWRRAGRSRVSCTQIAEVQGQDPTQVRKDLAHTGLSGRPKVGYPLPELIAAIENYLGWDNRSDAVLIGVGSLGQALLGSPALTTAGLRIVAAFDADPEKRGRVLRGCEIFAPESLAGVVVRFHVQIAILAVPSATAQAAAELAVQAGIRGIWNFAPHVLRVPERVVVEQVDLAGSLAVLCRRLDERPARKHA